MGVSPGSYHDTCEKYHQVQEKKTMGEKTRIVTGTGLSPNNSFFLTALCSRPRQL